MVENKQQCDFKTCFDSHVVPPLALLGIYHRQWLLCATAAALSPLRKRYGRERVADHMCISLS